MPLRTLWFEVWAIRPPGHPKVAICYTSKAATLFCLCLFLVTTKAADRCEELIKMDGLFNRAFQACPLSFYSFRFRQDAKLCAEKLGEAVSKPLTAKGQQAFESRAKELGKDGICRKLVSDFPLTLKP